MLRIFIGSSTPNLNVARAMADCLEGRNFRPLVWDEGLLRQNESVFDGLLRLSKEVEYGVFIWGASDVTISGGQSIPAARDNVVFETGLFLGALGKEKTFMVVDRSMPIKIPSDFAGIIRTYYDGSAVGTYDRSAVSKACNEIERSISQRHVPPALARLQGKWKSCFASGPFPDHPTMTDDVEITVTATGIHLTGSSGKFSYTGEGVVYFENQILGEWTHPPDTTMARGLFMLFVNTIADAMYGYCTSQDEHGHTVFGKWIFAKNSGIDDQVSARLLRSERYLQESTIGPALGGEGISQREDSPGRDLSGEWVIAVQPVYYEGAKWHVERVDSKRAAQGFEFHTVDSAGKLQWTWFPIFDHDRFLTGPWRSLRPTSVSHGYMTVQLAPNGQYMFGHDYGVVARDGESHFGVFLLGRDDFHLQRAWDAMSRGARALLPLSERADYSPT
jgi:hypothetical protein